jgi:hypothetical protein
MKTQKDDIDSFIDALRGDLPSEHDEARVRARLLASGVLGAAAAATSGVAAAGTAGAAVSMGSAPAALVKVGFLSKVLALPLAAKVGAATVAVALAAGVPVALEAESRTSPAVQAAAESRTSAAVQAPQAARAPEVSEPLLVAPQPLVAATTRPASIPAAPQPTRGPVVAAPAQGHAPQQAEPTPSTLAEETHLMERAMAALGEGDRINAGYWLAEHDRRFPHGLLAPERLRTLERLQRMATSQDLSAPTP